MLISVKISMNKSPKLSAEKTKISVRFEMFEMVAKYFEDLKVSLDNT